MRRLRYQLLAVSLLLVLAAAVYAVIRVLWLINELLIVYGS